MKELMRLVEEYDQAWVKGDEATLERMMTDDFTFTSPSGKLMSKSEDLADIKSGAMKIESARSDDVAVRIYGDTAVITGRWTAKGQYKGKSCDTQERFTSTWIKQQGRWQIVADHVSEIKQE